MKTLWLISFAIILSLSPTVDAKVLEAAPENECEGGSQMENTECVGAKLNIADQELSATISAIRKRLSGGTSASLEIDHRLINSQRAWVAYRQADCSLEGAEMLGGNGEAPRIQSCELARTIERLHELTEASF